MNIASERVLALICIYFFYFISSYINILIKMYINYYAISSFFNNKVMLDFIRAAFCLIKNLI